jgi:hypothetical protein
VTGGPALDGATEGQSSRRPRIAAAANGRQMGTHVGEKLLFLNVRYERLMGTDSG